MVKRVRQLAAAYIGNRPLHNHPAGLGAIILPINDDLTAIHDNFIHPARQTSPVRRHTNCRRPTATGQRDAAAAFPHSHAKAIGTKVMHLAASNEGSWGDESVWVEDPQAAIDLLDEQLESGDVVLVKASRAVGMERVPEHLLNSGSTTRGSDQ